jgi:hypothetical protein
MPFVTKVDYSDNRQVKQSQLTSTNLSGATVFGVDYSGLTGGVNLDTVIITGTYNNITSTFSGNSMTTKFFFGLAQMSFGAETLEVINNVTSGDTQIGVGYEGVNPTIIDGNTIFDSYIGSTFDLNVTSIEEVGFNEWTGTTNSTSISLLSGDSADFTGRAIWVDVKGIARTEKLLIKDYIIIENDADEATGHWLADGSISATTVSAITISATTYLNLPTVINEQNEITGTTTITSSLNNVKVFLNPVANIDININHLELAENHETFFLNKSNFQVTFVANVANSTFLDASNTLVLKPDGIAYLIRKGAENETYLKISN